MRTAPARGLGIANPKRGGIECGGGVVREVTWLDLVCVALVIMIFFVPVAAHWRLPDSAVVDRLLRNVGLLMYYAIVYGAALWIAHKLDRAGLPRRDSFWRRPVCKKK